MNYQSNGKGNLRKLEEIKEQPIVYPVSYELKAVMESAVGDEESKEEIVKVFKKHNINFSFLNKKASSKGSYVSFTFKVTIASQSQMHAIYDDLKKINGLRFAI